MPAPRARGTCKAGGFGYRGREFARGIEWFLVAAIDIQTELADLDRALSSIEAVLDPDTKRAEIADYRQHISDWELQRYVEAF